MSDEFDVEAMLEAPFHKGQVVLVLKFISLPSALSNKKFLQEINENITTNGKTGKHHNKEERKRYIRSLFRNKYI
jgi:hypothetical protein